MGKEEKVILGVLQNIYKNVNKKEWKCLIDGCDQVAINSHLLQVNGILNHLLEDGHLIQIKPNDFFEIEKNGFLVFKSLGISQAISEFLFCNKHDTALFKDIEGEKIDFGSYRSQVLVSYRSLCCELRKKMKNIEVYNRIKNSNTLNSMSREVIPAKHLDLEIQGHNLGIKDMSWLKQQMEIELTNNSAQNFIFKTFIHDPIKVCVSAVFSPLHPGSDSLRKAFTQEKPLNTVFINVVPQAENLYTIIGYHKDFADTWITDYVESWGTTDSIDFQKKLTNLLATRVETWSISPHLFREMNSEVKQSLKDYWNSNAHNLLSDQKVDFNLFQTKSS